jgi:ATP-dependent Clp protease ATP-binding subunit ClpA
MKKTSAIGDGVVGKAVFDVIHNCSKRRREEITSEDLLHALIGLGDEKILLELQMRGLDAAKIKEKLEDEIKKYPRTSDRKTIVHSAIPCTKYVEVLTAYLEIMHKPNANTSEAKAILDAISLSNTFAGSCLIPLRTVVKKAA